MSELYDVVAKNIYELRTAKKMTQSRLAEVLNYTDKAVSKWERGESMPDVAVLKQIAEYFEVSVDYLLSSDHTAHEKAVIRISSATARNRFIIAMLAGALVWLIATFSFVFIRLTVPQTAFLPWLVYVYAAPICCIVLLIFNSLWGRRKVNFVIISVMIWTILTSVYLSFSLLGESFSGVWLIFVLGIPAQAIVVLWSGLKSK